MGYMGNGAHGHNLGHMGNGKHGQRVSWLILQVEMGHLGGWGTWVMGHMANGAHGHVLDHVKLP